MVSGGAVGDAEEYAQAGEEGEGGLRSEEEALGEGKD